MTTDEIIVALRECRKVIPGGSTLADAAAADYLIRRLRGEASSGMVMLASADTSQLEARYGDNAIDAIKANCNARIILSGSTIDESATTRCKP